MLSDIGHVKVSSFFLVDRLGVSKSPIANTTKKTCYLFVTITMMMK